MDKLLIPLTFLALTGWFLFGSAEPAVPATARAPLDRAALAGRTLRTPISGEPTIVVAGMDKACQDCHGLFASRPKPADRLVQHTDIVLAHGSNDSCLTCHDDDDRGRLVVRSGERLAFADSATLCADCHGPTWRDWQAGTHGRTDGYWDGTAGAVERRTCVACHDPHAPAFPRIAPLPGPAGLRQVDASPRAESHLEGPLARFRHVIDDVRAAEAAERATRAAERAAARAEADAVRARLEDEE